MWVLGSWWNGDEFQENCSSNSTVNSAKDLKLKLVFWNDDYRA